MGFLLNGSERAWFDSVAIEVLKLAGVDNCVLWKFATNNSVSGSTDCIYEEPVVGSKHYTSFPCLGSFEAPTQTQEATEMGLNAFSEGRMYFSKKNLEDLKVPADPVLGDRVVAGDVVQLFRTGRFWYFDLKNVERTGWINDSQEFTHWVADMVRNEDFTPERKISGT